MFATSISAYIQDASAQDYHRLSGDRHSIDALLTEFSTVGIPRALPVRICSEYTPQEVSLGCSRAKLFGGGNAEACWSFGWVWRMDGFPPLAGDGVQPLQLPIPEGLDVLEVEFLGVAGGGGWRIFVLGVHGVRFPFRLICWSCW